MTIIMSMNIYIRPDLEEHLRKEPSMSGLVNRLLHAHYNNAGYNQGSVPVSSGTQPIKLPKDPKAVRKVIDTEGTGFISKSYSARKAK